MLMYEWKINKPNKVEHLVERVFKVIFVTIHQAKKHRLVRSVVKKRG